MINSLYLIALVAVAMLCLLAITVLKIKDWFIRKDVFVQNMHAMNSVMPYFYIEDTKNVLLYFNKACLNTLKVFCNEPSGSLNEINSLAQYMFCINDEVTDTSQSLSFCILVPNNSGSLIKLECTKIPYLNNIGKTAGVITFLKEIKSAVNDRVYKVSMFEQDAELVNHFSDGQCQFEYFSNGEGRFRALSSGAEDLLGLNSSSINKTGITGCISPAICDEDRVNIARAFKSVDSDTNKLTCSFRYNSKGEIRQCKFIAIRDFTLSGPSQSSLWHGIFIDLGLVNTATQSKENLPPPIDRDINTQESWLLFRYHQALVDGLTLNLINFKICQQPSINDVLNDTANIVFMLDDLVQQYDQKWLDYIANFKGKAIVVAASGEQFHYYTESIVQIPLTQFSKVKFATLFCHSDSPLPNKAPFQPCNFKVLIAEDNQVNQFLIKNQLEQLGCDVTIVCNGKIALEKLNQQKFDIVITDCQMPVIDGFELAKQIRQNEIATIRDLPIIGLTADNSKDISVLAHNVGINRVLFKPYVIGDLYDALVDLVESSTPVSRESESLVCNEIIVPDLSQWVGVFGSKADTVNMARIFNETLEADILALEKAIEENNIPMCQKVLHRIKGSIVMVKMNTITQQIEECEAFITLENRIDDRLYQLVNNLLQINKVVLTWLV